MTLGDCIRKGMKERKVTQKQLLKMFGLNAQSGVSRLLADDGKGVRQRVEILDFLGYEVVVRERRPGRRADGEMLVEVEGKDRENKTSVASEGTTGERETPPTE